MGRAALDSQRTAASAAVRTHAAGTAARAGCVKGRRMATVAKCRFDLEVCGGVYVNEPCVVDGNLVSGRTYHDHGHYVGVWVRMLREYRASAERRDPLAIARS